uniref:Myristoylated alanine-rich C-kinase substrate n=1 Tax=Periophthalmus magnuspinnatus TaxID=409849 RepID=A0A3B3ZCR3_9GOBI
MGAQTSKGAAKDEAAGAEGAVVAAKANGQENGHAKTNGDASPTAQEAKDVQANGSTPTEEAPKEDGEKAEAGAEPEKEPAATNGDTSKPEEGAPSTSDDKQKKKRFSFKKPSFKLSGFSFKKTKKESEEAAEEGGAAAAEEGDKPAEDAPAEETKPAEAAPEEPAPEAKAEEAKPQEEAKTEDAPAEKSPEPAPAPAEADLPPPHHLKEGAER